MAANGSELNDAVDKSEAKTPFRQSNFFFFLQPLRAKKNRKEVGQEARPVIKNSGENVTLTQPPLFGTVFFCATSALLLRRPSKAR